MRLRITTAGLALSLSPALAPVVLGVAPGPDRDAAAANRAFLEWERGHWDARITMPSPEGGEPAVFSAEQTDRLGACGLWLITDLGMVPDPDGGAGPPYEGHGVLGWDPAKEKLVGVWVDSKTHWLAVAEGEVAADGKTLTLIVEGRNPLTGQPMPQEFVTTRLGDDERRLEIFVPLGDGERMLAARIDYTRRATGDRGAGH